MNILPNLKKYQDAMQALATSGIEQDIQFTIKMSIINSVKRVCMDTVRHGTPIEQVRQHLIANGFKSDYV